MRAHFAGLLAIAALTLTGCAYPVSSVNQGSVSQGFYFPQAPAGAHVLVDGVDAGEAAQYDGKRMLLTSTSGPHHLRIVSASGAALYDQNIYLGAGSKLAVTAAREQ